MLPALAAEFAASTHAVNYDGKVNGTFSACLSLVSLLFVIKVHVIADRLAGLVAYELLAAKRVAVQVGHLFTLGSPVALLAARDRCAGEQASASPLRGCSSGFSNIVMAAHDPWSLRFARSLICTPFF
jgi:hypothetical protein